MTHVLLTIRTAMKALRRNVMRSALTTLGIVIGVAAVIAMMEIGQGAATEVKEIISRMGANNLMIQSGAATSAGVSMGSGSAPTLTLQDSQALQEECGDLLAALAPVVRVRTQVVYGNKNWVPFYLNGTTPQYLEVREWTDLAEGQCFTDQDVRNGAQVCLVGQTIVRELFDGESPIDKEVRINHQPFKIVGVMAKKGANMMGIDQDDMLLAPWTAIKYKVAGTNATMAVQSDSTLLNDPTQQKINTLSQRYPSAQLVLYPTPSATQLANNPQIARLTNVDYIWARVATSSDVPLAKRQITDVLHREHRIRDGQIDDFAIRDMTEQNAVLGSTSDTMSLLLPCIACISLIVGGVGIMNIMLVSVTERTREIGLRMAVGARPTDILRQFLTEAVILCLMGGAFGIAAGRLTSEAFRVFKHWRIESSPAAIVASVTVSVLVGVVFGYYPAWKASRMDPITALRYE